METKEEILNEYIDTDKDNGYQNGMWKTILEAMQAYKDQSEWVPISEAKPTPESFYLVVANKGSIFMMYYGLGRDYTTHEMTNCWFYDEAEVKPYLEPTHWMSLPKMPER